MPTSEVLSPCPANYPICNEAHHQSRLWRANEASCEVRKRTPSLNTRTVELIRALWRGEDMTGENESDPDLVKAKRFMSTFRQCPFMPPPPTADHDPGPGNALGGPGGDIASMLRNVLDDLGDRPDPALGQEEDTSEDPFKKFIDGLKF